MQDNTKEIFDRIMFMLLKMAKHEQINAFTLHQIISTSINETEKKEAPRVIKQIVSLDEYRLHVESKHDIRYLSKYTGWYETIQDAYGNIPYTLYDIETNLRQGKLFLFA